MRDNVTEPEPHTQQMLTQTMSVVKDRQYSSK